MLRIDVARDTLADRAADAARVVDRSARVPLGAAPVALAPEPLRARRIGVAHRPVVVAVGRRVTPSVGGREAPHGQRGDGAPHPVRAVEHAQEAPTADGRGAIALTLARAAPAAAKRAGKGQATEAHDTPPRGGRKANNCGRRRRATRGR